MTVSATEVGRFVEEAHLWTSKDMPRDVARFKLCVNTAEAKMRRLRRSEKGSSSIGDAKSQILNEPKDMVAFYDSRSPRLDFAAFNCSSKSAEENLDGYHRARHLTRAVCLFAV